MSTSTPTTAVERCRQTAAEPVVVPAEALESTAPDYLRDVSERLADSGQVAVELAVTVGFEEDCSFAVQDEIERLREYVRVADFLGVSRLTVDVAAVADEDKVRPALAACAERAGREGVTVEVDGPLSLG